MKHSQVRQRVFVRLVVGIFVLVVAVAASFSWYGSYRFRSTIRERLELVSKAFDYSFENDARSMTGFIQLLEGDSRLREAFLARDRSRLLQTAGPLFEELRSKQRVTHFYFHDPSRVCFLRVPAPDRFGDVIQRLTMDAAARTEEVAHGVEMGVLGTFTLRVVYPWKVKGRLIGYIELGEEIEHIASQVRRLAGVELLLKLDKIHLDRTKWEDGMRAAGRIPEWDRFDDSVLVDSTHKEIPQEACAFLRIPHSEHAGKLFELTSGGRQYYGGFRPCLDAAGRDVGDMVTLVDVTAEAHALNRALLAAVGAVLLFGALMGGVFWIYLGRVERSLAVATEAVRDRNKWLNSVLNASAEGIVAVDENGTIRLFSAAAEKILGCDAKDLIGKPVEMLTPGMPQETLRRYLERHASSGEPTVVLHRTLEVTGLRNRCERFPMEVSLTVSRQSGRQIGVAILRDVSDRNRQNDELRAAKANAEEAVTRLRTLSRAVEQSPASIVITDLDGSITYVNPGFVSTTGYTSEEAIGKNPRILKSGMHPSEFYAEVWQALLRGEVWRGELCNRKKNGEMFWEAATIAPVLDANGRATHFVAIKVDVTARKQAAQELQDYARRLEQANRELEEATAAATAASQAKSQFLATMSHELRTPLNGVIGTAELLRDTSLDERQRRFVDACYSSGKTLLDLINKVLDFSKIEAGKVELEEHGFDLEPLIRETIDAMAYSAGQKGLRLSTRLAPQTRCRVQADSVRLRQILVNLVGNAVKFTEAGEVTVNVERLDREERSMFRFEVRDTGIGIPPDRIDRLFQSFCQADSSTTRKYGGTGLGLAISKSLVALMGGAMGVESQPGAGSTFWFEIPLKIEDEQFPAKENDPSSTQEIPSDATMEPRTPGDRGVSRRAGLNSPKRRRVLLAEDNQINQMVVQEVLSDRDIQCSMVENGLQAVQAVQDGAFDLVLMDCQMPHMDGYDATRRIRELERAGQIVGHVPVLALTANATKGDRERCLEAGMDDYISKPFDAEGLLDAIDRLLASIQDET